MHMKRILQHKRSNARWLGLHLPRSWASADYFQGAANKVFGLEIKCFERVCVSLSPNTLNDEKSVGQFRRGQGRRQEFFRGRALGAPGEGSPAIFQIPGGGAQPRFLVVPVVKMKEFCGQGGPWPPCLYLSTPLDVGDETPWSLPNQHPWRLVFLLYFHHWYRCHNKHQML